MSHPSSSSAPIRVIRGQNPFVPVSGSHFFAFVREKADPNATADYADLRGSKWDLWPLLSVFISVYPRDPRLKI